MNWIQPCLFFPPLLSFLIVLNGLIMNLIMQAYLKVLGFLVLLFLVGSNWIIWGLGSVMANKLANKIKWVVGKALGRGA